VATPATSCPWASDGRTVPDYHGVAMSLPARVALADTAVLTPPSRWSSRLRARGKLVEVE
jgi:hypothetical protein